MDSGRLTQVTELGEKVAFFAPIFDVSALAMGRVAPTDDVVKTYNICQEYGYMLECPILGVFETKWRS